MADIRGHNPNLRNIYVRRRGELPNSRGKSAQVDGPKYRTMLHAAARIPQTEGGINPTSGLRGVISHKLIQRCKVIVSLYVVLFTFHVHREGTRSIQD